VTDPREVRKFLDAAWKLGVPIGTDKRGEIIIVWPVSLPRTLRDFFIHTIKDQMDEFVRQIEADGEDCAGDPDTEWEVATFIAQGRYFSEHKKMLASVDRHWPQLTFAQFRRAVDAAAKMLLTRVEGNA
jgi:hypothetical protein